MLITRGEFIERTRAVAHIYTRKGQAEIAALTAADTAKMTDPETHASHADICAMLAHAEMSSYRLPTIAEVLAVEHRTHPEWTGPRRYYGQHWADSSIAVYLASVVYPDGRVEEERVSRRAGGFAFRLIRQVSNVR